jgi:hypothetical protein
MDSENKVPAQKIESKTQYREKKGNVLEGSIEENIIPRTKSDSEKNRRECSTLDSDISVGNIQAAGGENTKELASKASEI